MNLQACKFYAKKYFPHLIPDHAVGCVIAIVDAWRNPTTVQFCNAADSVELITMVNELSVGQDGWAQLAPFGDYPGMAIIADGKGGFKKEPAVQRLDAQAVATMANEYAQSSRGISGFFKKRPLFEGHPDSPVGAHKYPNKSPVGVFLNIKSGDGLLGEPALTEEGERLIGDKTYRALSGRWYAVDTGETTAAGLKIYRPVKFLSAGLTNHPNLPVQMLNEAEPTATPKNNMIKKIIPWLAKHGITIANDATEDQVETALAQLDPKIESAKTIPTIANERDTLKTEKQTQLEVITARDATITEMRAKLATAQTSFANERKARVGEVIGSALTTGRITAAEKPVWETRLGTADEAQFANELNALTGAKPKVKTESKVIDLGGRKVEIANEGDRRTVASTLVNSIAQERGVKLHEGNNYAECYQEAVKRAPGLFEAMKQPGKAA